MLLLSDKDKMRNLARKYAQTSYSDDEEEQLSGHKSGGKETSSVKRENVETPIFSSDQFQPSMPMYQKQGQYSTHQ